MGTGVGDYAWRLPNGYGIALGETGDGHWETNHHLLNLSGSTAAIGGEYTFHVQDTATYPLARMFTAHTDIRVPPSTRGTAEGTFIAPFDIDLVLLASHLHEHGVSFEMFWFDGTETRDVPFYTSTEWDRPRAVLLDPPLRLARGQGITYRCTYDNFESTTLVYGTTTGFDMCSLWNYYAYPTGHGFEGRRPPELGGENKANGSRVTLKLGGTSEGSTLETLALREHQSNVAAAAAACPQGLAATDAGLSSDAGAGCSLLSDPCYLCIGVTCGASFSACNSDTACQGASAVATQCVCDAQAAQDNAAIQTCVDAFASSGALATAFTSCLTGCNACGF